MRKTETAVPGQATEATGALLLLQVVADLATHTPVDVLDLAEALHGIAEWEAPILPLDLVAAG